MQGGCTEQGRTLSLGTHCHGRSRPSTAVQKLRASLPRWLLGLSQRVLLAWDGWADPVWVPVAHPGPGGLSEGGKPSSRAGGAQMGKGSGVGYVPPGGRV